MRVCCVCNNLLNVPYDEKYQYYSEEIYSQDIETATNRRGGSWGIGRSTVTVVATIRRCAISAAAIAVFSTGCRIPIITGCSIIAVVVVVTACAIGAADVVCAIGVTTAWSSPPRKYTAAVQSTTRTCFLTLTAAPSNLPFR